MKAVISCKSAIQRSKEMGGKYHLMPQIFSKIMGVLEVKNAVHNLTFFLSKVLTSLWTNMKYSG